jgi:hypothetical protein
MHDSPRSELPVFCRNAASLGGVLLLITSPQLARFSCPQAAGLATVEAAGVWLVFCAPKAEDSFAGAETWERGAKSLSSEIIAPSFRTHVLGLLRRQSVALRCSPGVNCTQTASHNRINFGVSWRFPWVAGCFVGSGWIVDREEALTLLSSGKDGVKEWNRRKEKGEAKPELDGVNLRGAKLSGADLSGAKLKGADLSDADLGGANLIEANLNTPKLNVLLMQNRIGAADPVKDKWNADWSRPGQFGRYTQR